MVNIENAAEDKVQVTDDRKFVTVQDVGAADSHTPYAVIEAPDNYAIGVHEGTPVAPTLLDANGDPIDQSTRLIVQKRTPQGNPIGDAIVFDDSMDVFDYSKMRSDERYFRRTSGDVLLDEGEQLAFYAEIPAGSNGVDAANSRFTVGDNVTSTGKPVSIIKKDDLNETARSAVDQASTKNQ